MNHVTIPVDWIFQEISLGLVDNVLYWTYGQPNDLASDGLERGGQDHGSKR